MSDRMRLLVRLLVVKAIALFGFVLLGIAHEGRPIDGKLLHYLIVVGLPLVLGSWFRHMRYDQPPVWWYLRQYLPGATGERLPPALLLDKLLVPPWFLLPLILVFGCLGVATENLLLLSVPVAVALGWVVAIAIVTGAVLFFGPLLLIPLLIYGAWVFIGTGDLTSLLTGVALTTLWLLGLRLLPMGKDVGEALVFVVGMLGVLVLGPVVELMDNLQHAFRFGTWVEVIAEGSSLIVQPSTVGAGKVKFRVSNKGHDEELVISILRTDLRPSALPADLESHLRPHDAVRIMDTDLEMGDIERADLSLPPGRYVIGCQPWAGMSVDEVGRYTAMRATLMVEPAASKLGA